MKIGPLLGTIVSMMVIMPSNGTHGGRLTNYDVLNAQVDSLSTAVTGVLSAEHDKSVFLKTGPRVIDGFVRQRLLENLLKDKFRVVSDSGAASVVRVLVPLLEVTYSSPVTSHIFGSSDVVRKMRSEYDVEISDSSQVTFAKSFVMAFRDTVSESDIPYLESGSYDFLHGRIESRSFFDNVLQPVLFVASAAVIVYLFFTLRGT